MAGRRPKPTQAKILKGTFRKHRQKKDPEIVCDLPGPPEWLSGEARNEWDRLHDPLVRAGILTGEAWSLFVAYCATWGRLHDKMADGDRIDATQLVQLRCLAGSFGLDPATRSKLAPKEKPEINPFDGL